MMDQPIFRFAPSPNGELHLGHAYSALLNLKLAREMQGKMLLRIEDIDLTRCTREHEVAMLEDLEWIGFEWDETPFRQSENFDAYKAALNDLEEQRLLFASTLSRSEIRNLIEIKEAEGKNSKLWPHDPDGSPHYPGLEHNQTLEDFTTLKNSNQQFSLRFDTHKALVKDDLFWHEAGEGKVPANPQEWGRPILARKELPASYHLCSVLDDAMQGISHVVRGRDLYHATSFHRLLQTVFDLPQPIYHHHALIKDSEGRKLSKSQKDTSLRQLRQSGFSRQDVVDLIEQQCSIKNPFNEAG